MGTKAVEKGEFPFAAAFWSMAISMGNARG